MPTILRENGFRFFIPVNDHAPAHVHVERDDCEAKFWLDPVRLERSRGFAGRELHQVQAIIEGSRQTLLNRGNEYFDA